MSGSLFLTSYEDRSENIGVLLVRKFIYFTSKEGAMILLLAEYQACLTHRFDGKLLPQEIWHC